MFLARTEGWPRRLAEFLEARREAPFVWGGNDCASCAITAVHEVTRELVWPITWATALEAARVIRAAGGLGVATSSRLGPSNMGWRSVRRGDIALVDMHGREALTVCTGQTLCGPGPGGLEHLPLTEAHLVWNVG